MLKINLKDFVDKNLVKKGVVAAAAVTSVVLMRKFAGNVLDKIHRKVNDEVHENIEAGVEQLKYTVNHGLEKLIFECLLRWFLYIILLLLAYVFARAFDFRKDVLVAFVILGIYTFYVIKGIRVFLWYRSFCSHNGLILNPVKIINTYVYNAILERVRNKMNKMPLAARMAAGFFGPSQDSIAMDITKMGLSSRDFKKEVALRLCMVACGWIVYALIYEQLFLYITGIDFKVIWEPLLWPFFMLKTVITMPK